MTGEGKRWTLLFQRRDISSDDVIFEVENESAVSPAQRRSLIYELYNMGLLADENGKVSDEMRQKILDALGFGGLENARGLTSLHTNKAAEENRRLLKEEVAADSYDDDGAHIAEHTRFLLPTSSSRKTESQGALRTASARASGSIEIIGKGVIYEGKHAGKRFGTGRGGAGNKRYGGNAALGEIQERRCPSGCVQFSRSGVYPPQPAAERIGGEIGKRRERRGTKPAAAILPTDAGESVSADGGPKDVAAAVPDELREKIIAQYLSKVRNEAPNVLAGGGSYVGAPKARAKTLEEAARQAAELFKKSVQGE